MVTSEGEGARGCPLPGKGATLIILASSQKEVQLVVVVGGEMSIAPPPQVMASPSLPFAGQTLRCQALQRNLMRTSTWNVSPVQVNTSLYPRSILPEALSCSQQDTFWLCLLPLSSPLPHQYTFAFGHPHGHPRFGLWSRLTPTVHTRGGTPLKQGLHGLPHWLEGLPKSPGC